MVVSFSLVLSACATERGGLPQQHLAQRNSQNVQLGTHNMMQHLQELQKIAQHNQGNRSVGSAGGLASAEYIVNQAKQMGFQPQLQVFKNRENTVGQNILIEIPGESIDSAVIVGAHYDSVKMGPGINDNGSGVALLLELMNQYALRKTQPKYTLYFAFWDSEEVGIAGSQHFVQALSDKQLQGIKAYINVDMVGTKHPEVMIADADRSSVDALEKTLKARSDLQESDYLPVIQGLRAIPRHQGDLALQQSLEQFFKSKNIQARKDLSTLTASDTAPFLGKVPVTSIILFHEQMKGDVLEFAPCYHQACDQIEQVDEKSLQLAAEAVLAVLKSLHVEY